MVLLCHSHPPWHMATDLAGRQWSMSTLPSRVKATIYMPLSLTCALAPDTGEGGWIFCSKRAIGSPLAETGTCSAWISATMACRVARKSCIAILVFEALVEALDTRKARVHLVLRDVEGGTYLNLYLIEDLRQLGGVVRAVASLVTSTSMQSLCASSAACHGPDASRCATLRTRCERGFPAVNSRAASTGDCSTNCCRELDGQRLLG